MFGFVQLVPQNKIMNRGIVMAFEKHLSTSLADVKMVCNFAVCKDAIRIHNVIMDRLRHQNVVAFYGQLAKLVKQSIQIGVADSRVAFGFQYFFKKPLNIGCNSRI